MKQNKNSPTCICIVKMFFLWIVPFTHLVSGDWVEISQSPKIHRDLKLITNAQVTPTPINDAYSDIAEEIEDTQNSTLRLLPFVEMIQDTLLTNENKSTRKKTLFLQNLRDNLLINIGLHKVFNVVYFNLLILL